MHKLELLARRTGVIGRKRSLGGKELLYMFVFPDAKDCFVSLPRLVDKFREIGIRITRQSLHQRFTPQAVDFLKALAGQLLSCRLQESFQLDWATQFGRVMLLDSTMGETHQRCRQKYKGIARQKGGAFKLQYCFDLLRGNIELLEPGPGYQTDAAFRIGSARENDLWLFDLAYTNSENITLLRGKKAHFLCRYKFNKNVYLLKDNQFQKINLSGIIRKMKVGERWDEQVYWGGQDKIPLRMILEKVPPQVSEKKKRALKKSRKYSNPTKERIDFCEVNAYLTNLDTDQLPAQAAQEIYSIRWQIELCFKQWKSNLSIAKAPTMNVQRFEVCLWGALVRIIILHKIIDAIRISTWNNEKVEISQAKAFRYILTLFGKISEAILYRPKTRKNTLRIAAELLRQRAIKHNKKGKRKIFEVLQNPSGTLN